MQKFASKMTTFPLLLAVVKLASQYNRIVELYQWLNSCSSVIHVNKKDYVIMGLDTEHFFMTLQAIRGFQYNKAYCPVINFQLTACVLR